MQQQPAKRMRGDENDFQLQQRPFRVSCDAAAPMMGIEQQTWESHSAARIQQLEAELASAHAIIRQQQFEAEQLRSRCTALERGLRGTYGDGGGL